jgi:molybdopterin-containing oxidoreductase family iron-sulfur binding subunit
MSQTSNQKKLGKKYWRTSNAHANQPKPQDNLQNESLLDDISTVGHSISRRSFLNVMGASLALAGLSGCRRPVEKIIPYVVPPEEIIPGIPEFYATAMPYGLDAVGLIVENHEGRPTKIEGNPDHPSSLGKTNALIQAEILNLYDPDRSQEVLHKGQSSNWELFLADWNKHLEKINATDGQGLAVIGESSSSPTVIRLKKLFMKKFPLAKWVTYDAISNENIYNGNQAISGQKVQPVYHFDKAKIILSLDSDFLHTESRNIVNAFEFSKGRRVQNETDEMNRLYVVESSMTVTGGMADHRLRLSNKSIITFVKSLALQLIDEGLQIPGLKDNVETQGINPVEKRWIKTLATDLLKNRGKCIITAGSGQPEKVHALVYILNSALGNANQTVDYYPLESHLIPDRQEFAGLTSQIEQGTINTLIMLGGNPVFNSPGDLHFAETIKNISLTINLSTHVDETSQLCDWHLPCCHFLEAWGDTQSFDGFAAVTQPQIQPLFVSKSIIQVLGMLISGSYYDGYVAVRETWKKYFDESDFERSWHKILHDGLYKKKLVSPLNSPNKYKLNVRDYWQLSKKDKNTPDPSLEIVFSGSNSVYDGRYANNSWLQELPDPVTKITWDNIARISQKTAKKFRISNSEIINISANGRSISIPVWIIPGQADETITLELGYGRWSAGKVGTDIGIDVTELQSIKKGMTITDTVRISGTGRTYPIASTQDHHGMDTDAFTADSIQERIPLLIREGTLDEYKDNPTFVDEIVDHPPLKSMWEEHQYDESPQWGMSIDLNVCTGCNACTIACQSENNIPVVGKDEVMIGREMHWLRMDRYYTGDMDDPELVYQPVGCQHCENAPCEQVCPVAATTHTEDGLNGMTYNRCIGTRYCSNNCPYKVRRFNFFNYTKDMPELIQMAQNPDVTVRFRGVMEKCTYCVQRISKARITAKNENRSLADGDVVTACEQVCPADAIVFGDIIDPSSRISKIKSLPQDYKLLNELNTKPRTSYLAKLRNPNPELSGLVDKPNDTDPAHE